MCRRVKRDVQVLTQFIGALDDEFCGSRGCRGTQIGDKVRNGVINLMSYRGNHRDLRGRNGAGDPFFVEGPQIFERSTTATNDQDIQCGLKGIEGCNALGNFLGGPFPLHTHWIEIEMDIGETPMDHVDNVANRRPRRRSDNANALRHNRQRTFTCFVAGSR